MLPSRNSRIAIIISAALILIGIGLWWFSSPTDVQNSDLISTTQLPTDIAPTTAAPTAQPTPTKVSEPEIKVEEINIVEVTSTPPPPPQGGNVVESSFADITTLNPILGNDTASATVYSLMFQGLARLEAFSGSVVPHYAKSWEHSVDGLTYTFTLREDIFWSDGRQLTTADVAFTFEALRTAEVASPRRSSLDNVASWTAVNDYTFEIELTSPDCTDLSSWGVQGIIPAHVYNNDPRNIPNNPENLAPTVVSGPFTFVEYAPGNHVILAANPDYFLGKPNIDRWTYKIYPDQSSELAALLAGEVTWTTVGPQFVATVEESIDNAQPFQIRRWFSNGYTFVAFNMGNPNNPQNGWDDLDGDGQYMLGEPPLEQDPHPILGDKLVRQAISSAIDYEGIINNLAFGQGGRIVANVWPSIEWAYNAELEPYAQDLEAAEALLDEAGWKRENAGSVRMKDGIPLTLKLMTNVGGDTRENIGLLMKETLDSIGFNIELDYREFGAVTQELLNQTYDMAIIGFGGGAPEPDDSSQFSFRNDEVGVGFNFVSFYNEQFEANLSAGITVPGCSEEVRGPIYRDNQRIFKEETPYAMLYVDLTNAVWHDDLQQFDPNAWNPRFNIEQWYLEP